MAENKDMEAAAKALAQKIAVKKMFDEIKFNIEEIKKARNGS